MKPIKIAMCVGIAVCCYSATQAQGFLKKVKEAANKVVNKNTDNATGTNNGNTGNNENTNSGPGGSTGGGKTYGKPSNKGGGGLVSTPPDVNENLVTAETSFKSNNYGESRYAIQQAMLGVELKIGQNILKSLPMTVAGLKADSAQDQVTSTGWGWAGLTIQRVYVTGEKQFTFTIANNAMWMQAINLYLTNGGYSQTTGGEQKWKQTKLKGHRGVIEYNESSGYKLSVPLGQTSLLMFEGINFANEQDMMNAANQIDIDAIKKALGEK
jgi:hypothetical protein